MASVKRVFLRPAQVVRQRFMCMTHKIMHVVLIATGTKTSISVKFDGFSFLKLFDGFVKNDKFSIWYITT